MKARPWELIKITVAYVDKIYDISALKFVKVKSPDHAHRSSAISWRHLSTHSSNLFFLFGLLVWDPMVARYKLFMCVHPCKPACLSSVKLRGQSTRRQMHTFAAGDCKESLTSILIWVKPTGSYSRRTKELHVALELQVQDSWISHPHPYIYSTCAAFLISPIVFLFPVVKPCSIFLLLVENVIFSVTFSSCMAGRQMFFLKLNFWIVLWSLTVSDFYFWVMWEVYVWIQTKCDCFIVTNMQRAP